MVGIKEHLTRQMDIIPSRVLGEKINVIGCGAIGSFTVLSLAKMGFENIEVWDDDVVDTVNLNCQFFRFSDVGKPKALALRDLVKDFTGVEIRTNVKRYEGGSFSGIVVSAVDSMSARKLVFDSNRLAFGLKLLVDPRMSAESAALYTCATLNMDQRESYAKTLYSDETAVQERCTAKATMYTVNLISGYTTKVIKDYLVRGSCLTSMLWSIKDDEQVVGRPKVAVLSYQDSEDSAAIRF
jgi:hypothetical protein